MKPPVAERHYVEGHHAAEHAPSGQAVAQDGGIADAQVVGDTEAAVKWIRAQPSHNGKVGIFGSCSGGRHAFIYACTKTDVDACVAEVRRAITPRTRLILVNTPHNPTGMMWTADDMKQLQSVVDGSQGASPCAAS